MTARVAKDRNIDAELRRLLRSHAQEVERWETHEAKMYEAIESAVSRGVTASAIARELGWSRQRLHEWRKAAQASAHKSRSSKALKSRR